MNKSILVLASAGLVLGAGLLHGCGGGGASGSATVSAYLTDDLAGYQTVALTVNSVQLRHTGLDTSCQIIAGPLSVDVAQLGRDELIERVDITQCEAGPYNRLHVELAESVTLVQGGSTQQCKFVSYYPDDSNQPDRLACANGSCAVDLNGAVNLVAGSHEHVTLDADLKQFTVEQTPQGCEVTLKLSPLHAAGMDTKMVAGYRRALSGLVSNLDAANDSFTLTERGLGYRVLYAGVTDQAGLDELLARAATDGLRTRVRCESIDSGTTPPTCVTRTSPLPGKALKAIGVKAEGTVSGLDTGTHRFTLGYAGTTLPVNYHEAFTRGEVEGTLADGVTAETALYGFASGHYLAREVEVENGD